MLCQPPPSASEKSCGGCHRLEREAALALAEPRRGGLRLDEPRPGRAVGLVVLVDLRAVGPPTRKPDSIASAAQLVADDPARRARARMRLRERRSVAREAAAEAGRDDRALGVGDLLGLELDLQARHRPGEGGAEGDVRIAGHRRQRGDRALGDRLAVERAAGARREHELALGERGVEALARGRRARCRGSGRGPRGTRRPRPACPGRARRRSRRPSPTTRPSAGRPRSRPAWRRGPAASSPRATTCAARARGRPSRASSGSRASARACSRAGRRR